MNEVRVSEVVVRVPIELAQQLVDDGRGRFVFGTRSAGFDVVVDVVGFTADVATVVLSAAALPIAIRELWVWFREDDPRSHGTRITISAQDDRIEVDAAGDPEFLLELVEMISRRERGKRDE